MHTHAQIHRYTVCFEHTNTLCAHTQNCKRFHPHIYMHTHIPYTPEKAKARDTLDPLDPLDTLDPLDPLDTLDPLDSPS